LQERTWFGGFGGTAEPAGKKRKRRINKEKRVSDAAAKTT
jgi:hypothetical protein